MKMCQYRNVVTSGFLSVFVPNYFLLKTLRNLKRVSNVDYMKSKKIQLNHDQ